MRRACFAVSTRGGERRTGPRRARPVPWPHGQSSRTTPPSLSSLAAASAWLDGGLGCRDRPRPH
eukprot:1285485-Alexandrium_andersonii.AAC.1